MSSSLITNTIRCSTNHTVKINKFIRPTNINSINTIIKQCSNSVNRSNNRYLSYLPISAHNNTNNGISDTNITSRSFATSKNPVKPSMDNIPVIDLSASFSKTNGDGGMKSVAKQINDACRTIGFFTITGHNIPQPIIDNMWNITRDYFDLSEEIKSKQSMSKDYPYGYSGVGGENLTAGYNKNEKAKADPKESFTIGPSNPAAGMPERQWPLKPNNIRKYWEDYYIAMENLAAHLMRLFAISLELPTNYFDTAITRHRSALRALNYPAQSPPPTAGSIRAGEHTDYGSVTILLQDVGGLQVQNRNKEWINARPIPNTFVINLGDLMQRWTNDQFVSTLHRVINMDSNIVNNTSPRRQSIAFFHNINPDHVVKCIETCTSSNNPPRYPPIKAWDLLIEKHEKAMKAGQGKY